MHDIINFLEMIKGRKGREGKREKKRKENRQGASKRNEMMTTAETRGWL